MSNQVKRTESLLTIFGILSVIVLIVGWFVIPLASLTLTEFSFFAGIMVVVVVLMVQVKKMPKILRSAERSFFLTILSIISVIASGFFIIVSCYTTLELLFSGNMMKIASALKIISLSILSAYFFSLYLDFYLVGVQKQKIENDNDNEKKDSKPKISNVLEESPKHSYLAAIFIIFNIIFTSCIFQGIIVMKNQTGFMKWFSEIFSVLKEGSDLYKEFSLEPVDLHTFSNVLELLKNDHTPVILSGILLASIFIIPLLRKLTEMFKQLIEMLRKLKVKIIEQMTKWGWINPPPPDTGCCVECKENVKLIQFVLYSRQIMELDENDIIDGVVQSINQKMSVKGIRFDVEDYKATYVKYGTVIHDKMGNKLNMFYACSKCYATVYKDFLGNSYANGKGITHVKIIGGRNTGKSCFIVSVFSLYRDTIMIDGTPEYKYFFDMWEGVTKKKQAPESTNGNVLSSPVLTIKHNFHYLCLTDIAGEHDNIGAAAGAVGKDDIVALLVDVSNTDSIREASEVLAMMIKDLKKVVICITKIDKYPQFDCMQANATDIKSGNKFINNITNSKAVKKLRKKFKSMFYEEEKITQAFLEVLSDNMNFVALYNAALNKTDKVSIVAHAGLGTDAETNYKLKGNYEPKYIEETINTFIS